MPSQEPAETRSRAATGIGSIWGTAVALALVGGIGLGIGVDRVLLDATQPDSALEESEAFSVLEQTYDVIRDEYVLSDSTTDEELLYGAASGMVHSLGDTNHSRFLDPEEARRFQESSRGELIGVGINIDTSELPLKVIMPIPDSPAAEAGVQPGDSILEIDGVNVVQLADPQAAVELIRGDEGTQVTFLMQREDSSEQVELTMTRAKIEIQPVSWAMLPGDVLWVRIDQFSRGASDGLKEALQTGSDLGAQGLVLDLRANPGGLVLEALGVGGQLQPSGSVLFQQEDADGAIQTVETSGRSGIWQDRPIVVLIDRNSASAAEIVASSLAENDRATLVGETTSGTGTVLLPIELSDGSIVLIGTELWLTPDGNVIWHNGVTPDEDVAMLADEHIALPSVDMEALGEDGLQETGDSQLVAAHAEALAQRRTGEATPLPTLATPGATPQATPVAVDAAARREQHHRPQIPV